MTSSPERSGLAWALELDRAAAGPSLFFPEQRRRQLRAGRKRCSSDGPNRPSLRSFRKTVPGNHQRHRRIREVPALAAPRRRGRRQRSYSDPLELVVPDDGIRTVYGAKREAASERAAIDDIVDELGFGKPQGIGSAQPQHVLERNARWQLQLERTMDTIPDTEEGSSSKEHTLLDQEERKARCSEAKVMKPSSTVDDVLLTDRAALPISSASLGSSGLLTTGSASLLSVGLPPGLESAEVMNPSCTVRDVFSTSCQMIQLL